MIGSTLGGLAGGNSFDRYEGDSKDSYLQKSDGQSSHTLVGSRNTNSQKLLGLKRMAKKM